MATRRERGLQECLYLIEIFPLEEKHKKKFAVMGTTGNAYDVTIQNVPECTCLDFLTRNIPCKHIYFVLLKVVKSKRENISKFTDEMLEEMFNDIPSITSNLIVNEAMRIIYRQKMGLTEVKVEKQDENGKVKRQPTTDICPICMEELEDGNSLDYCKYGCGKSIHVKCFTMWCKKNQRTCVFCRTEWEKKSQGGNNISLNSGEYINLISDNVNERREYYNNAWRSRSNRSRWINGNYDDEDEEEEEEAEDYEYRRRGSRRGRRNVYEEEGSSGQEINVAIKKNNINQTEEIITTFIDSNNPFNINNNIAAGIFSEDEINILEESKKELIDNSHNKNINTLEISNLDVSRKEEVLIKNKSKKRKLVKKTISKSKPKSKSKSRNIKPVKNTGRTNGIKSKASRARNAYNIFVDDYRKIIVDQGVLKENNITTELTNRWNNLSDKEKNKFEKLAQKEQEEIEGKRNKYNKAISKENNVKKVDHANDNKIKVGKTRKALKVSDSVSVDKRAKRNKRTTNIKFGEDDE